MPQRDIREIAVGALLDTSALERFGPCLDSLSELVGTDGLFAVAQVRAAGADGLLALTVDELLFVSEVDLDITGEPLSAVRTCFADPTSGRCIVITLDDASVLEFTLAGTHDDAHWLASAVWSAAVPPPPAPPRPPASDSTLPATSVRPRLLALKQLHDEDLITNEDYELRRRAILDEI